MKRYSISVLLAAIALCAISCVSEPMNEIGRTGSDVLRFSISTAQWGDTLSVAAADVQCSLQEPLPVAALTGCDMQLVRSLEPASEGPETRAVEKSALESSDGSFNVVCYVNSTIESGASFDKDHCHLYFPVRSVSYDSGLAKWQAAGGDKDLWMPASNLRFCAWWPSASLGSAPQTFACDQTAKKLSFQLDKPYAGEIELTATHYAAEEQRDLLVSVTDSGNTVDADQALSFRHALTAVQFCTTNNIELMQGSDITIKRITIKNVAYKGVLDLMQAATDLGQAWTVEECSEADLADFTVRPSLATPTSGIETLNAGDKTFFMLPQSLDAEVPGRPKSVEIEFTRGTEHSIFSASLTGLPAWQPGQTVRYLLGQRAGDAYIIYVDAINLGPAEVSTTVNVHSYRVAEGGSAYKVPFKVTGVSIDGGRTWNEIDAAVWTGRSQDPTDSWMTNLDNIQNNSTGTYSGTPLSPTLNLVPNPPISTVSRMDEIDAMMQAEPEVTDRDLSLYDAHGQLIPGGRCTANCYVVSGAGSYKFPTVYGNAILDGGEQLDQCSLPTFRNFNIDGDDAPSNAWINRDIYHQQGGTVTKTIVPVRAVVLWQQSCYYTEPNPGKYPVWVTTTQLINPASVTYYKVGNEGMISFQTCAASDMHQGNAVIALLDADDTVLWSWHIWFTSVHRYLEGSTPSAPIPYTDADDIDIDPEHNGLLWTRENLGTIYWGMIHSYANRGAMLRLQQTDTDGNIIPEGSTAKVQVNQMAGDGSDYRTMTNLFYQHGNKNPYPTCTPRWSTADKLYTTPNKRDYSWFIGEHEQLNGMDGVITDIVITAQSRQLPELARKPWAMFYGYGFVLNMWSIKTEPYSNSNPWESYDYDTQKTIYDPNPYPYCVGAFYRRLNRGGLVFAAKAYDGLRITNPGNGAQLYFPYNGYYRNGSTSDMSMYPISDAHYTAIATSLMYGTAQYSVVQESGVGGTNSTYAVAGSLTQAGKCVRPTRQRPIP